MDHNPSPHPRKPSIGRRLLSRQAMVARSSGLRLGRTVAARHERPEPARAALRLVPKRAGIARAAAPAAAAPAPPAEAWVPSATESTILPGISDWASEWMFGDADTAIATGSPFAGGADFTPRTPEQKRLSRIKRGAPEVARAARIVERPTDVTPAPAGDPEPASSTPAPERATDAAPVRLSRGAARPASDAPAPMRVARSPRADSPARTAAPRPSAEPPVMHAARDTSGAPRPGPSAPGATPSDTGPRGEATPSGSGTAAAAEAATLARMPAPDTPSPAADTPSVGRAPAVDRTTVARAPAPVTLAPASTDAVDQPSTARTPAPAPIGPPPALGHPSAARTPAPAPVAPPPALGQPSAAQTPAPATGAPPAVGQPSAARTAAPLPVAPPPAPPPAADKPPGAQAPPHTRSAARAIADAPTPAPHTPSVVRAPASARTPATLTHSPADVPGTPSVDTPAAPQAPLVDGTTGPDAPSTLPGTPAVGLARAAAVGTPPPDRADTRARIALKQQSPEPAVVRPAVRRVERAPVPETAPEELTADSIARASGAESPAPARGLLRRVAGALRSSPPPPPPSGPPRRAPAPTPAATARPAIARRSAPMTLRDGARAAAAPPHAATIARAGLGAVDAADDSTSVTFPVPGGGGIPEYVPFSTAPVTMSRSLADLAGSAVRERAEDALGDAGAAVRERAEDALGDAGAAVRERAGSAVDAVTSALPGARTSGAGAADKAFEELYDRLKRELMNEQEQLGQLFHEP